MTRCFCGGRPHGHALIADDWLEHKPKRRLSPDRSKDPQCPKAEPSQNNSCEGMSLPPPLKAPRAWISGSLPIRDARALEREWLKRRVDEIGLSLSFPAERPSARDRMAALRQRVGIAPCAPHQPPLPRIHCVVVGTKSFLLTQLQLAVEIKVSKFQSLDMSKFQSVNISKTNPEKINL